PVAIEREGRGLLGETGRAQRALRRAGRRQVGERDLALLHLLHEDGVGRGNLPHARFVRVDADVPDLHRVGRTPEGPGVRRDSKRAERYQADWKIDLSHRSSSLSFSPGVAGCPGAPMTCGSWA